MKLINRSTVLVCFLVVLVGLALMAYMGFYNRYWGDDWCYNRDINNLGLWKTINTYFLTGEEAHRGYSTNRYGLTLLYGLFFLPGLFGTQIIATLLISFWIASLAWTFSNLSKLTRHLPIEIILLGSAVLLYFNLFFSPQRFQVLYWQAGVHYSFSVLTGVLIVGMITSQMVRPQESKLIRYLTAPLALLGGAFRNWQCLFAGWCNFDFGNFLVIKTTTRKNGYKGASNYMDCFWFPCIGYDYSGCISFKFPLWGYVGRAYQYVSSTFSFLSIRIRFYGGFY